MKACNPDVYTAFKAVATHNLWGSNNVDMTQSRKGVFFNYLDGFHDNDKPLFSLLNFEGANGVHRAHFREEMVKYVPEDLVQFRKPAERVEEGQGGPVNIHYEDGTAAVCDAVVGADGIKSHVRQSLLGAEKPQSHAYYTYKYCYRGLIPIKKARAGFGEDIACKSKMHLGPNGHILTMPIDKGETMNVVAFTTTKQEWSSHKSTAPTTKQDALHKAGCFEGFCRLGKDCHSYSRFA
jgi:salicylate hydroxylase